jgi:excisionase family DNA binding protein
LTDFAPDLEPKCPQCPWRSGPPPSDEIEATFTIEEVAFLTRRSPKTVRNLMSKYKVPHTKGYADPQRRRMQVLLPFPIRFEPPQHNTHAEDVDSDTAAALLGISMRHLERLRTEHKIPYVRIGHKTVRYPFRDVIWMAVERRLPDLAKTGVMPTIRRAFDATLGQLTDSDGGEAFYVPPRRP